MIKLSLELKRALCTFHELTFHGSSSQGYGYLWIPKDIPTTEECTKSNMNAAEFLSTILEKDIAKHMSDEFFFF